MFGQFRRLFGTESRSAEIDAGALFAAAFQFTGTSYSWTTSPALLVSSLSVPDGSGALLLESRRLAATSPLLRAYRNVIESGVLTGEPEPPTFPDTVPENITTAVGEMWMRLHDCDRERDLLDRCIVDGEFLELDDGTIIPPDGFEPVTAGPKWLREVVGYKIGTSSRARMAGLRYVGDRPAGTARALPWIGPALPSAAGLLNTRTGAAHGLGSLAKIAAVIANASPDRITANVGARSGLVQQAGVTEEQRQPIHALPVGSVPFLRSGEAVDRIEAGPDETARKYEAQLERDIASALNLPLSELLSDYSSGSFSNLRMAWQDAEREIARRRTWWHRHYRTPLYLDALSSAFASGQLPRMNMAVMAQLKRPAWRGPVRQPPQAEAGAPDAQGLTAEEREFRQLESRAELRQAFRAVMNGSALTGAEKELQEHRGLSGHNIPWDLIAPRVEERADAVSAAPADSHLQQHGILARVFARSATATLGVAMPMVPTGEQNYPVITTTDNATILAKDAAEGDTADAGITAHTIAPTRLQRSYLFRREDQAVLAGLEEALRADLSMAVSDLLDQQVLAGDGTTGAQFSGFLATAANGGIPDRSDSPARVTFALAAGEAARGIDGKYAGGLGECSIVIGDDTARDLASKFTTNGEESALAYMSRTTRATMASANIPAVASMFQEGILARMGAAGANAICPTWDSMFMIRDEISGRKSGQIALTIGMLAGFDILRADGFDRLKFKVA